jgi:hypothetical protein
MFKNAGMKLLGVGAVAYAAFWFMKEMKSTESEDSATETFNMELWSKNRPRSWTNIVRQSI